MRSAASVSRLASTSRRSFFGFGSKKEATPPPTLPTCHLRWTALPSALPMALHSASSVVIPADSALAPALRTQVEHQLALERAASTAADASAQSATTSVSDADDILLLLNAGRLFAACPAAFAHYVPISLSEGSVTPTAGASLVYHSARDELFVIGKSTTNKMGPKATTVVWVCSPLDGKLEVMEHDKLDVNFVSSRKVAAGDSRLFVLGDTYYDEIHENPLRVIYYDRAEDTFGEVPISENTPLPRTENHIVSRGDNVYVLAEAANGLTYDMHTLNANTLEWSRTPLKVAVGASVPDLRPEASSARVGKHVVMFGGLNYGKFMQNCSVLDLDQLCWLPTEVQGELPDGRIRPSVTALSETSMLMSGGKNASDELYSFRLDLD
mmetsp:Transcript_25319/g.63484  ORF Transcript_25319/g.63484 Transcript_25319/m.63484 type:complete len:383 (+) Transcript_25319:646-1794(+)|eukprot:CAMPEP_0177647676 /NCGR_PEP_ID=MMETSP0447-20121125/10428_1 /TAXON_ID=0 /ORGANISM="Stygamoeba regulata, Strain BSH-02190019" /LENGTH=382 /DNA_ID=CAMNT_0019150279 /DNA_START=267 /DNA_END=1415 /DNA_ORIENTATION=+